MDANEHPGAGRLVVTRDGVLAVPAPQQFLEHDSTLLGRQRLPKPLEAGVERLVRDASESRARPRPREPESFARRDATRALRSSARRTPIGELEPDEERSFATGGRERRGRAATTTVATRLVQGLPLRDRLLRAGQRCDGGPLQRRRRSRRARVPAATTPAPRAPRSRPRSRAASPPCRSSSRARRARPRPRAPPARRGSSRGAARRRRGRRRRSRADGRFRRPVGEGDEPRRRRRPAPTPRGIRRVVEVDERRTSP